jgi:hypothetical protein
LLVRMTSCHTWPFSANSGSARANADPNLAAARDAVLERTGAEASYATYEVLAIKQSAPAQASANLSGQIG